MTLMHATPSRLGTKFQLSLNPRSFFHRSGFLGLIMGGVVWSSAAASVPVQTLDQSHVVDLSGSYRTYNILNGYRYAQTFQAGIGGILSQVDVQVLKQAATVAEASQITLPLTLSILTVAGNGSPGGITLGTFTIPASTVPTYPVFTPQFTSVNVLAAGITVAPGQSFALMLTSALPPPPDPRYPNPSYGFITKPADTYATGNGWYSPPGFGWGSFGADFGFKTYVTPIPEPTALVLWVLGAGASLRRLRSKR